MTSGVNASYSSWEQTQYPSRMYTLLRPVRLLSRSCRPTHVALHHRVLNLSAKAAHPRGAPKSLIRLVSNVSTHTPSWIDRFPARIRPYLHLTRIDKPIGTALLFLPCGTCSRPSCVYADLDGPRCAAWSITMASYTLGAPLATNLGYLALFGVGALVMRGAGCTINDMWDKNLDKAVGTSMPECFTCFKLGTYQNARGFAQKEHGRDRFLGET